MKTRLNIRDIARQAGVSPITVSRALSPTPSKKVSEATRSKILKLCEKLRFHPNEHFRRINTRRANTVALIFSELAPDVAENAGFETYSDLNLSGCVRGAQEFLAKHDIDLLLVEATQRFLESKRYLKMIRSGLLDGIMLWGMTDNSSWLGELSNEDISTVMLQTESSRIDCDTVITDDYSAMRSLVKRALEAGHRNFTVVTSPLTFSIAKNRYAGMADTFKEHGIKPLLKINSSTAHFDDGRTAVATIMKKAPKTTCVISIFEVPAYGLVTGFKNANIEVPDTISVIAAGGVLLPGIVTNLTSYSYNSKLMGQTAAEILFQNISHCQERKRTLIPAIPIEGDTLAAVVNKSEKCGEMIYDS